MLKPDKNLWIWGGALALLLVASVAAVNFSWQDAELASQSQEHAEVGKQVHVRIYDKQTLLFSSWPHENGSFLKEYQKIGAAPVGDPIQTNQSSWPGFLEPLKPMMLEAPSNSTITVRSFDVPDDGGERIPINRTISVPRSTSIPNDEAGILFGPTPEGSVTRFSGIIPVKITERDGEYTKYRLLTEPGDRIPVPDSEGLVLHVAGGDDVDELSFTLTATGDVVFIRDRCVFGSYVLSSGAYEVLGQDQALTLRSFSSGLSYALGGHSVTVELTINP